MLMEDKQSNFNQRTLFYSIFHGRYELQNALYNKLGIMRGSVRRVQRLLTHDQNLALL